MYRLPTVLLRHRHPRHPHYDWLVALDYHGPLWTVRLAWPSRLWLARGRLDLEPLPVHRRQYLKYQGPIGGQRGDVWPVDAGWHTPRLWSEQRIVTRIQLSRCHAIVDMSRLDRQLWVANVTHYRQ